MKQEEFLEIIEQNKGKHRQPIETLIQGRRIGGIVGGGDTPKKETRKIAFDINTSSPVYIFGEIENDVLHLNVDENEGSWLATSEGEIRSGDGPGMASKTWIIQQFNEQGIALTDIVANMVQYEVGQIVPNWSQYETIG